MSARRAGQLKAELKALPKFLPEPVAFDWEAVQASLKLAVPLAKS